MVNQQNDISMVGIVHPSILSHLERHEHQHGTLSSTLASGPSATRSFQFFCSSSLLSSSLSSPRHRIASPLEASQTDHERVLLLQPFRVSLHSPLLPHSFKKVREQLGEQTKQCDIFRTIADQWKLMTPEQKQPYVDEVRIAGRSHVQAERDRGRYKREVQNLNKIRKEIENSLNQPGSFAGVTNYKSSHMLQQAFQDRNAFRVCMRRRCDADRADFV